MNAGVVVSSREVIRKVTQSALNFGATLDSHACYQMERGLKTLALRVRAQNENAGRLARFLRSHEAVSRVIYPGLPDHPDHAIAARQMRGFGGMLSFELRQPSQVDRLLERLELGLDAPRPRLSWLLESSERGQRQTAYQVLAATSPARLSEGKTDLWDSGKWRRASRSTWPTAASPCIRGSGSIGSYARGIATAGPRLTARRPSGRWGCWRQRTGTWPGSRANEQSRSQSSSCSRTTLHHCSARSSVSRRRSAGHGFMLAASAITRAAF